MYKKGINRDAFEYLICFKVQHDRVEIFYVLKEHAFEFSCYFSCVKKRDLELFQRRLRRPGKRSFFLVCL